MSKDILDCWPFPYKPRGNQVEALKWLANPDFTDVSYKILELPVGSGKSNIGITYSIYLAQTQGDSFILTPQKILQEQYETSFANNPKIDIASLYGKTNYQCHEKKSNCEIGGMLKPECDSCPFKRAKKRAKSAHNTVMNYKLALLAFGYTNMFKEDRSLLILDECHTLEEHLVDFDAVKIMEYRCKKYELPFAVQKTIKDAVEWIEGKYLPKLTELCNKMRGEVDYILDKEGDQVTSAEVAKIKECNSMCDHFDEVRQLSMQSMEDLTNQFVLVHDNISFAFKRLYGSYTFKHILEPRASNMLFMSSTVLNKNGFCKDLGIDPKDAAFLSLPSEFAIENRPVYFMPHMKMNVAWSKPDMKADRDMLLNSIKKLLELHKGESGIIHTANFQIARWLVEELEDHDDHRIYHHNPDSGDSRGNVITAFMEDPQPALLISPSITEGLDLKDDLGRFAIILKVPFGHLGDQWIKRRMEISSEWYQRRALIDIIQGGGRVVRGPEDKGTVYILDGSWSYLMKTTNHMIPKWWKEAYQLVA